MISTIACWSKMLPWTFVRQSLYTKATEKMYQSRFTFMFNHADLMSLVTEIRDSAIKGSEKPFDFDNKSLSDSDILTMTGILTINIDDLQSEV